MHVAAAQELKLRLLPALRLLHVGWAWVSCVPHALGNTRELEVRLLPATQLLHMG